MKHQRIQTLRLLCSGCDCNAVKLCGKLQLVKILLSAVSFTLLLPDFSSIKAFIFSKWQSKHSSGILYGNSRLLPRSASCRQQYLDVIMNRQELLSLCAYFKRNPRRGILRINNFSSTDSYITLLCAFVHRRSENTQIAQTIRPCT